LLATCCEPGSHPERATWQARVVELLGQGVEPCVPRRSVVLAEGVEMAFRFVPPGTFLMGSPPTEPERDDDETQHLVTLTKGYWLGDFAVTQAQWRAVMGSNPSQFKGDTLPVDTVSWNDCQEFVKKLSRKSGKRFVLPTEGQWERACRAGTTTPFHFGETISTEQANYDGNDTYGKGREGVYREMTTPVGRFPANAWGVHDLHGNVLEWCSDVYGPYASGDAKDPQGSNNGTARVLRGGSWLDLPSSCRSAFRRRDEPGLHDDDCGCRVLLCLD
jgi:formylglycine-generating enzyme required for sulfatase activity